MVGSTIVMKSYGIIHKQRIWLISCRGSEERVMEERDLRDEKRDKAKHKKFNKNMKQLRMEMRSSLYDRTTKGPHTHEYGEETYHEDEDNYTHACTICGFVETYEKM